MQTVLFFDIDSTLVENQFSRKALGTLLQEIADHTGLELAALGQEMAAENSHRQKNDPDNVLTMDWDDILETIAQKYDVTLSAKGIDLWRKFAHKDDVIINDKIHNVLDLLKAEGYPLIIATKGLSKYQYPVLEVAGLLDYFDEILAPDVTGYLKTTPAYFERYADRENTLFIQVGDHYLDDVICPKRNGFMSVMRFPQEALQDIDPFERPALLHQYRDEIHTYPEEGTDIVPDAVAVSLQELPAIIKRIEAQAAN